MASRFAAIMCTSVSVNARQMTRKCTCRERERGLDGKSACRWYVNGGTDRRASRKRRKKRTYSSALRTLHRTAGNVVPVEEHDSTLACIDCTPWAKSLCCDGCKMRVQDAKSGEEEEQGCRQERRGGHRKDQG